MPHAVSLAVLRGHRRRTYEGLAARPPVLVLILIVVAEDFPGAAAAAAADDALFFEPVHDPRRPRITDAQSPLEHRCGDAAVLLRQSLRSLVHRIGVLFLVDRKS